jgi:Flp pilus assembly protein TadG
MTATSTSKFQRQARCVIKPKAARRGAAVTEFAIMLPLIVMIVFGSIEMSNGIFMKQAIGLAAYEGARAASRPGGTLSQVQSRVQEVLDARGITGQSVTVTPNINTSTARGTRVSVSVQASAAPLSMNPLNFLFNKIIERTVVMVRL